MKFSININEFLFKKALNKCHHIFIQTKDQKKILKEKFEIQGKQIYNAHPEHTYSFVNFNLRDNNILWIGRIIPRKKPQKVLWLAKKLPEYNFHIIGPVGNQDFFARYFTEIEQENVKYLGEMPHSKILDLLSRSKLFISTSESEGLSNTFIEAWKTGTPIITFYVDPDNIISDKKLGVKLDTNGSIARQILEIIENENNWNRISNNCLKTFKEEFSLDSIINDFEKYIHENINFAS